ncbi:MAG TPA: hypothetical protein VLJ62_13665 [Burkholderiaceae bacterium]|nr:hypothetical protein [Burkholderiaceae bacterium]
MYRSISILSLFAAGLLLALAGCATPPDPQHDHGAQTTSKDAAKDAPKDADCKKMAQMHAAHHGASAPAGAASAASKSCSMMKKG